MDTTTTGLRPGRGVLLLFALVTAATFGAAKVPHEAAETALEPVVNGPSSEAVGPDPTAPPPDLAEIPGGTADWWSTVTASIAREEYKFTVAEAGLQAPNRAQNFRSRYREAEVELEPRERSAEEAVLWRLSWRTKAWGRPGTMTPVSAASSEVNADGTQVTYRHEGMIEWYENRKEGLEQGFTVAERPAGEGPLRIEGEFTGAARPVLREDGAIDLLDENDVAVVRYGELMVRDAKGEEVPASLVVAGSTVAIVVEDGDAAYPLMVDPLMTTPAWTTEGSQSLAFLGTTVSTAGDVNGDGFSDVIVGAVGYDNGQEDEGRAYLFHGSSTGLATSVAWTGEGNGIEAHFGRTVSAAGDVNNDGFSDVVIEARGRTLVYHGSPGGIGTPPAWTGPGTCDGYSASSTAGDVNGDGFSDLIIGDWCWYRDDRDVGRAMIYRGSPTGLSTSPAWIVEGPSLGSGTLGFGISVATAGDVNGDGYSDIIVGAPYYSNGVNQEGAAFVYHGSPTGIPPSFAWMLEGNDDDAHLGFSVATAGDVNGDGFSDVIIGAHDGTHLYPGEGLAYVFHGGLAGLWGEPGWTAYGNQAGARFGKSVATAGDVNGDGFSDVIVGAPSHTNGEDVEGRAFVYQGTTAGLATSPAWTAESNQDGAQLGESVATAGDVNGDGFSDVIVGAPLYGNGESSEGVALVYRGSAGGLGLASGWTAQSNQAGARLGTSVSTAGDVNGDGFLDVIVGAPQYDGGMADEGRVSVYYGSSSGPASTPAWAGEGNQPTALFGASVATAGDVNGDGYSDIVVGAPWFDNGQTDEGRVYIFHGSSTGIINIAARILESNQASAYFGTSVSTAGNVNGDAYSDVIIGAYLYDNGQSNEGRAYVYHGSATGIPTSQAWTAESNQAGAWFGAPVSTAGDVNGDGFSDVIVGARFFDNGEDSEGSAFVYHGSGAGLASTASWTGESNQASATYGISVSTAGDVNGDGFSDVIVGASGYDNGQTDEGKVYVYHGSPSGLSSVPLWSKESNQAGAAMGWSVSTAGDVNDDGYSDVVVGTPEYDSPETDEGRVYIYLGSEDGLMVPVWDPGFTESNQTGAWFGISVSTAGDVNGDGYSDVIIGASLFDSPEVDEGMAFIYYGNGGLSRMIRPRQVRVAASEPIAPLGRSDSPFAFRLQALGSSPAGRARVWLEYEVEKFGVPFDGLDLELGPVTDTGVPQNLGSIVLLTQTASGQIPNTSYHWRVRVATDSPFFPHSRWVSPPGNAPSEMDLSTAVGSLDVAAGSTAPGAHLLIAGNPNPFTTSTELAYNVPAAGRLRLKVYSVTGREVAGLVDETQTAGEYRVRWDGRDREGQLLPAGVYFARLELGDRIESQKLVLAR